MEHGRADKPTPRRCGRLQTIASAANFGQWRVMHALKKIAEWILGVPEADPGQGTAWRYVQNFPWPSWALLIFTVVTAVFVVAVYRRDAGHLSRRVRVFLAGLRLAALALLLFMLSEAVLSIERTGLPF